MKRARFTSYARSELHKGLGARFRSEVEAVAERAATFPASGAPVLANIRRRLVPNFPFTLVYTETDYGILIHAVAHNRRLPEYWVGRLGDEG